MRNHNISFGERSDTHDLVRKPSMMYDANDVTYRQLGGRREGQGGQPTLKQACSCCAGLLSIIGDFGCAAAAAAVAAAVAGVWRRPTTKAVRHDRGRPASRAGTGLLRRLGPRGPATHAGVVDKVLILRPCDLSAAQSLRARHGTAQHVRSDHRGSHCWPNQLRRTADDHLAVFVRSADSNPATSRYVYIDVARSRVCGTCIVRQTDGPV